MKTLASICLAALPGGKINRGFEDWAIVPANLVTKKILEIVHGKDVIGLGRTIKAAETAVEAMKTIHTDSQTPDIVLCRQKALHKKKGHGDGR